MILPIILARGGSKSVPRKNIRDLTGKPLLSYVLTEALKVFPKVYLSTEDEEIAEVARIFGATVLARPQNLALDDTSSVDTVKYHLKELQVSEGHINAILLLNACCPFTKAEDIQGVIDLYEKEGDSVVSLVEDFSAHPSKTCYLIGNKIYSLQTGYTFKTGERQKLAKVCKRNTAMYLAEASVIKRGSFFGQDCRGYVMPIERSYDINSEYDMWLANLIMKNERSSKENN